MAKEEKDQSGIKEEKGTVKIEGTKTGRKITVDADSLARLLERSEELTKRLARVEATADLSRLENFDQKSRKQGPLRYRLSTHDGKLITGWRTTANRMWKDGNIMRHQQEYEILMEDNTKEKVSGYDNFSMIRYEAQVIAEQVKRETVDGSLLLTLKILGLPSSKDPSQIDTEQTKSPLYQSLEPLFGKEVTIDATFVN